MNYITCADQTDHGAWEIYGVIGFRRYYGCTKLGATQRYVAECREQKHQLLQENQYMKWRSNYGT